MALATYTLATTTFSATVAAGDSTIYMRSTSGITPGVRLYANRELMTVDRLTGIGTGVVVLRGQHGTATRTHSTAETVYIGQGDQFFADDPVGVPPNPPRVSPRINVLTGVAWVVQGDQDGPGANAQTWQPITTTQTRGSLGVRVNTTTTPS